MTDDAYDFVMGGGIPSASFLEIGTVHKGRIRSYEVIQQRDFATGNPKVWDDGRPMMQAVFTLETEEREHDDDDGLRKVYAKAQMLGAIREAIRRTKHQGDFVGGVLAVKYVANDEPSRPGFNPPKVYKAQFEPPDPLAETEPEHYDNEEPF